MRHAALALLLVSLPLAADLRQQIVSLGPGSEKTWVGYTIPAAHVRRVQLCCSLDDDNINVTTSFDGPAEDVSFVYGVRSGAIVSVRPFTSCGLDRSRVRWLSGVDSAASVALLADLSKTETMVGRKARFALSLHNDGVDPLIDLAHHGQSSRIRSDALFWLAQTAASKAAGVLRDAVDHDPDEDVRAKAVFGIAQLPADQSIPLLDELMRTHKSAKVRKKAAFWLGQMNDPRALAAIESFLRH